MAPLTLGDRVAHPEHGNGMVLKKKLQRSVLVAFDASPGLPRTVPQADLRLLTQGVFADEQAEAPNHLLDRNSDPAGTSVGNSEGVGAGTREFDTFGGGAQPQIEGEAAPFVSAGVQATSATATQAPQVALPVILRQLDSGLTSAELDQADGFQILEAMRLGVVPMRGVGAYTVGRDKEIASIQEMLAERQGCRIIWGDYGTGKTHLLDVAEQTARHDGFATARVVLDPSENALNQPLSLYKRIAESIRMPDADGCGLDTIFSLLHESPDHNTPHGDKMSRFFSGYLHVLKNGCADDQGWFRDYVHGDRITTDNLRGILRGLGWENGVQRGDQWVATSPLALMRYRTYGRMYIHMIGTLATWARDAGAKGLVLFFDEVERVDVFTGEDRFYAEQVLKHYAAVTMRREELAFDPEELYRGGQPVHRALPLRFDEDQPLSVVFALTPLQEIEDAFEEITEYDSYDVRLRPLTARHVPDLTDRIASIYEMAYPRSQATSHVPELISMCKGIFDTGSVNFRGVVRQCVALLDMRRLHGGK